MTRNQKYPAQTIAKYILLQIPALILLSVLLIWFFISSVISMLTVLIVIMLWMVKDLIMFFFVWKSYTFSQSSPVTGEGTVTETLNPEGYVQVGHELWRATSGDKATRIRKGSRVVIKSVKGLTLVVEKQSGE